MSVLSGALESENLDTNEFQALIDDLTMTIDTHFEKLSAWALDPKTAEA